MNEKEFYIELYRENDKYKRYTDYELEHLIVFIFNNKIFINKKNDRY